MIVAGVDLAAEPRTTAVAVLDGRRLAALRAHDATDDVIVELSAGAARVGVDCPLGWPDPFVDFVARQAQGQPVPPAATIAERRQLAYRATDLRVAREHPPLRPLSVSADRIAHAAFRCAGLLPRLDPGLDRSGLGRVVEAYPAGSLCSWHLPFRGYKGAAGREVRAAIVDALAGVLDLDAHDQACRDSDHALDAVLAALTALAAARGRATRPEPAELALARREGWIVLPTAPPAALFD